MVETNLLRKKSRIYYVVSARKMPQQLEHQSAHQIRHSKKDADAAWAASRASTQKQTDTRGSVATCYTYANCSANITYSHLLGGRDVGARTPIHRHDFSATTHVLTGYATVFLEGSPPTSYGPGESYYMPPGGLTMTSAIMPNPIYGGEPVRQTEFSTSLDANAFPTGTSVTTFVEVEVLPDGGTFDWRSDRWERCAEYPRYACSIPPSIEENPQDSTTSVQEEANSAPNKEISQESEHAGPEKSSTS